MCGPFAVVTHSRPTFRPCIIPMILWANAIVIIIYFFTHAQHAQGACLVFTTIIVVVSQAWSSSKVVDTVQSSSMPYMAPRYASDFRTFHNSIWRQYLKLRSMGVTLECVHPLPLWPFLKLSVLYGSPHQNVDVIRWRMYMHSLWRSLTIDASGKA